MAAISIHSNVNQRRDSAEQHANKLQSYITIRLSAVKTSQDLKIRHNQHTEGKEKTLF